MSSHHTLFMGAAFALLLSLGAGAYADDSTLKQDAKTVGHETGEVVHKVGEAGKEVGKKVAETAREVGHATRDGAREFKAAVTGEGSAHSSTTKQHTSSKSSTASSTASKPVDTSLANK
jgi:hypothetical protein